MQILIQNSLDERDTSFKKKLIYDFFKIFKIYLPSLFLITFLSCSSDENINSPTSSIFKSNKISLSLNVDEQKKGLKFYTLPSGVNALVGNNFVTNIDAMGMVGLGYTNITTTAGTDTLDNKTFIGLGVRLENSNDFVTGAWTLRLFAQGHDFTDGTEVVYATEGNGKVFKTICGGSQPACDSDEQDKVNEQLWSDLRFYINADVPNGSYSGTIVFEIYSTP